MTIRVEMRTIRSKALQRTRWCPWLTAVLFSFSATISAQPTVTISEYAIPTAMAGVSDITAGPDGALWFTEFGPSKIGRITTTGVITEYVVSLPPIASSPPPALASRRAESEGGAFGLY